MNLEELKYLKTLRLCKQDVVNDADTLITELEALELNVDTLRKMTTEVMLTVSKLDMRIQDIRHTIDQIPDRTLSELLKLRYDEDLKIADIADKLHFSPQWIQELLKRGLEVANNKIEVMY